MPIPFNSNLDILTGMMINFDGTGDDAQCDLIAPYDCSVRYVSIGTTNATDANTGVTVENEAGESFAALTVPSGAANGTSTTAYTGNHSAANRFRAGSRIRVISDSSTTTGDQAGVCVAVEPR